MVAVQEGDSFFLQPNKVRIKTHKHSGAVDDYRCSL